MMRSLFSGVSGLRNHQTRMDVIGNNISNVNTVGFKASRVQFQDVLSQTIAGAASAQGNRGGTNPMQVGLGMGLASIDTIFTDGSFQPTGKGTDLSIQGQGFFVLSNGNERIYTRAGNFDFDTAGNYLVPGTGYKVVGWMADATGAINTAATPTTIQIPVGATMPARASTTLDFANNLSGDDPIGSSVSASRNVYDSLGNAHAVNETFTKVGNNRWIARASVPDALAVPAPTGLMREITFNSNGSINTIQTAAPIGPLPQTALANTAFNLNSTLGSVGTSNFTVFDAAGAPHTFRMTFTNTGATTWNYSIYEGSDPNAVALASGVGTLAAGTLGLSVNNFNYGTPAVNVTINSLAAGSTAAAGATTSMAYTNNYNTAANAPLTFTPSGGATAMSIALNLGTLTQYGGESTVQATGTNGYAAGTLSSQSIDPSGIIVGRFTNGQSQNLGQVALATFNNPAGLNKVGENLFAESNNSGVAQVGTSGTGGRGKFNPGTLEMANVDLANEFSNMIITQRGFQANSKIISVTDEMLQELANLKR